MLYNIILAFFASLVFTLVLGKSCIKILRCKQGKGQPIRTDGPQSHLLCKKGTPTMGGFLIIASFLFATLLFADLFNPFVIISVISLIFYAFMGFVDDYIKVTKQTSNAMRAKTKLLLQFLFSFIIVLVISYYSESEKQFVLTFPFLKQFSINLWYFYVPFAMVVITGASNAINLTDGLDGLVSGLLIFVFVVFGVVAYNSAFATQEISVLCAALIGALLGFLRFNFNPAKVFMGDTGSLALGALVGIFSVILKSEILFAIVGLVFVIEACSVMLQVWSYRIRGKRLFLMAPIHHHFEQLGWSEKKVVYSFWAVGFVLMLVGLAMVA